MSNNKEIKVVKNNGYIEIYRQGFMPIPSYEFKYPMTDEGKMFWEIHLAKKLWFTESAKKQLKKLLWNI